MGKTEQMEGKNPQETIQQCQEEVFKEETMRSTLHRIVKQQGLDGGIKFKDFTRELFSAKTDSERNIKTGNFERFLTSSGISGAEARHLTDIVRSAGSSTQHLIAKGENDKALDLNRGIGSGKFKSADDIFAQMQKWGYSSFVQQERARLTLYEAELVQNQIENIQQRAGMGLQVTEIRAFAQQLNELSKQLSGDSDYADSLKRDSSQLSECAERMDGDGSERSFSKGKAKETDGGIVAVGTEIKTTLENAKETLSSVVADANKAMERIASESGRVRLKENLSELPEVKITKVPRPDGIKPKIQKPASRTEPKDGLKTTDVEKEPIGKMLEKQREKLEKIIAESGESISAEKQAAGKRKKEETG